MALGDDAAPPAALVTGAAGGIGGAVVEALSDAGFVVAGHDQRPPVQRADHALESDLLAGDPRDVVRAAEAATGGLDVLVHCAGGGPGGDLLELTDAEWRAVVDLNMTVAFPLCQEAARGMVARGGGRLILVGSLCGRQAWRGYAHYCAAKAGLEMLGRCLALELASSGVRCNTIIPGTIDTPLNDAVTTDPGEQARLLARTPVGRLGRPEEVAAMVAWLATAPDFLTGASLEIDGGYSIELTP
jgi:NAD(P)-dependent dehydrogenase (short-subunit alcohol dehydrogenase family)